MRKPSSDTDEALTPPATVQPPAKLNRADAADYIGVQKSTLATWASTGGGPPFIKVGRKVVYLQTDLDAWIASRRVTFAAQLDERDGTGSV